MLPVTVNLDFLPFQYEGMKLQEACFINGNPYFTRKAVGEFLEYPRPQKAIDNIIARNPHISDQRWSVTLKLRATDGKDYETEIYDPIHIRKTKITIPTKTPHVLREVPTVDRQYGQTFASLGIIIAQCLHFFSAILPLLFFYF